MEEDGRFLAMAGGGQDRGVARRGLAKDEEFDKGANEDDNRDLAEDEALREGESDNRTC
jgi:hypothetical protein